MSLSLIGLIGLVAAFLLMALRLPVGLALLAVGFVGTACLSGWQAAMFTLSGQVFESASLYDLSVIPMFVLMGNLAAAAGLSRDLYEAAHRWIGHWRGGLASATIVGCAGFAALSGSSIASAITMGKVALPEMRRFGYADRLATGTVAAGGTLGILIPPSTGFVIYAILTESSIGKLFMAGVIPGLVLTVLFIVAIQMVVFAEPRQGPRGPSASTRQRLIATWRAMGIVVMIALTIGGIYTGVFTTVEAAGVGAFFALLMYLGRLGLDLPRLGMVIADSLRTTGIVFIIVIGANVFSPFIALTKLPELVAQSLPVQTLGSLGIMLLIVAIYAVLGMFIEGLSMLVLTLPIIFPIVLKLGYDPIWFGVIVVIVLEMGLISPPVGVNCFVVRTIAPDVKLQTIFAGIMPFWAAMLVMILLLIAFPKLATFLPSAMYAR
jgi:tripartite ATP-independent transporter DctM subunit